MALWRSTAIRCLPELRETIASAGNVMSLWIELQSVFTRAYREPRNEDLIGRIYSYADWCSTARRNDDASHDPPTAVAVAFYEHVPQCSAARSDMPRWFKYEEVERSKPVFAYHIGDAEFGSLLAYMREHKDRYLERQRDGP